MHVEKIVENPQIQMVQGTQTSESLGTAPVRQAAQVEIGAVGATLPAESGPPMFVNQPVLEAPVVVAYVEPTPVVEYMANVCTTRFLCGVRDSSTFRCLSGPSDHIDSGADSLPNCVSADRDGANRHCDCEDTPVAQQSSLPTPQTAQTAQRFHMDGEEQKVLSWMP